MRVALLLCGLVTGCVRADDPHEEGTATVCEGDGLEPGARFPDFRFRTCDAARDFTQSSLPVGRPYLLNVSMGPCIPCLTETPQLQAFHEAHGDAISIVQVLHLDDSYRAPSADFCDEWTTRRFPTPLGFTVLLDPDGHAIDLVGSIAGLPLNVVVDEEGCVVARFTGDRWPELEAVLESQL